MPNGLIVSSDDEMRLRLAEIAAQCRFVVVFASTVAEARLCFRRHRVSIVVCQEHLDDGEYDAIVKITQAVVPGIPVIVLSRTGDWAEYLSAIQAGVFDYLAYPPIPGELERIIQNALRACARRLHFEGTQSLSFGAE